MGYILFVYNLSLISIQLLDLVYIFALIFFYSCSIIFRLTFVVDHIAKPDIKGGQGIEEWKAGMAELAKCPNVCCKLYVHMLYLRVTD